MTTTLELQQLIIDTCKAKGTCQDHKLLLSVKDKPEQFLAVLKNNHGWCVDNEIYTPELLLQFDPELLHRAGWATQEAVPVDFNSVDIGGLLWQPYNHGASHDIINGSYHGFDEALALDYGDGLRQPTMLEHCLLASAPNMWGVYAGAFGRVFVGKNGNLFLPASGYRGSGGSGGNFSQLGTYGRYWSSSVYDANLGFNISFNQSNGVVPRAADNRGYGFPVRCVSE